jgi:hypothetical protein
MKRLLVIYLILGKSLKIPGLYTVAAALLLVLGLKSF